MEVTNENQVEVPTLTKGDLALASFALAETFNSYLSAYNEDDHEGASKEQMERSLEQLRMAFIKFDSLLAAMNKEEDDENQNEETTS